MTNDDFNNLFDAGDLADLEAVASGIDAEKAAEPKKDGVWFSENKVEAGHNLSLYAINLGGRTIAWATINNDWVETDTTVLAPVASLLVEGVTAHRIFIQNAHRTDGWMTSGLTLRYDHPDGTGVHADGNLIRKFIQSRVTRIVARFYGV